MARFVSTVKFTEQGVRNIADTTKRAAALKASAKNPCLTDANVKLAPNVDLYGTITIRLSADNNAATVRFEGMIETYPAFEMVVAFNGSEVGQPVFQLDVEEGATAANITGAPTRPVNVEAVIKREPAARFHTDP